MASNQQEYFTSCLGRRLLKGLKAENAFKHSAKPSSKYVSDTRTGILAHIF